MKLRKQNSFGIMLLISAVVLMVSCSESKDESTVAADTNSLSDGNLKPSTSSMDPEIEANDDDHLRSNSGSKLLHFVFGESELRDGPGIRIFQDGKLIEPSPIELGLFNQRFVDEKFEILADTLVMDLIFDPSAEKDYTCKGSKEEIVRQIADSLYGLDHCQDIERALAAFRLDLKKELNLSKPFVVIQVAPSAHDTQKTSMPRLPSVMELGIDSKAIMPLVRIDSSQEFVNVLKRDRVNYENGQVDVLETVVEETIVGSRAKGITPMAREIKLSCIQQGLQEGMQQQALSWTKTCQEAAGSFLDVQILSIQELKGLEEETSLINRIE